MKGFTSALLALIFIFLGAPDLYGYNYVIYAIGQKVPSGDPQEKRVKNYYVNMGMNQGLKPGTLLDVIRTSSQVNPFQENIRYPFNVKIGKLEILHTEEETSIGKKIEFYQSETTPLQEYPDFMLGDLVEVHINQ